MLAEPRDDAAPTESGTDLAVHTDTMRVPTVCIGGAARKPGHARRRLGR